MASIKITLNHPIHDGMDITFRTPCDCSEITSLIISHIGVDGNRVSQEFMLKDAHDNNIGDLIELFASGVIIKVMLDVTHSNAYILNADTNKYLEDVKRDHEDKINKRAKISTEIVDSQVAYHRSVPSGVASYAEITKFGGMSYKSENYIPFPYDFESINGSGFEVVIDSEQRLIVNGAVGSDCYYTLKEFHLPVGTYYLSAIQTNESSRVYFYKNGEVFWSQAKTDPEFRQFEVTSASDTYKVQLVVNPTTYKNDVVAPMISKDVPLTYSPYFEGLRHAKPTAFKSFGANLWKLGDIVANGYNQEIKNVFENLTPNKPYTLSWNYTSNGTEAAQDVIIVYTEAGGFNIANGASFTITQEQINTFNVAYAYFGSNATSGSMTNIMLNKGETALPYVPYGEPITLAIPAEIQNMDGYGLGIDDNHYNYIEIIKRKIKRSHKKVGIATLNGSEVWTWYNDNVWTNYLDNLMPEWGVVMSDCKYRTEGSNGNYRLKVCTNGTHTVESWKSYLASNPITVIYELAVPEVVDISYIFPGDGLIQVEDNGEIIPTNEYEYAIPMEIVYHNNANKPVSADVVGDLIGTATRAMYDTDGNNLAESRVMIMELFNVITALKGEIYDMKHSFTDGLSYEMVDGGYACTGIGSATSADIRIPSSVNEIPVVIVSRDAFKNAKLDSLIIPVSVKSVEGGALHNAAKTVIFHNVFNGEWETYGDMSSNIATGYEYQSEYMPCYAFQDLRSEYMETSDGTFEYVVYGEGDDHYTENIYVIMSENSVSDAPWGAVDATVHYNSNM